MLETRGNVRAALAMLAVALLVATLPLPLSAQELPEAPPLAVPQARGLEARVPSNAQGMIIIRDLRAFDQKLVTTGNRIVPGTFQPQQEGRPIQGPIMGGLEELGAMIADGSPLILMATIPEAEGEPPLAAMMFQPRPGSPLAARLGNDVQEVEELDLFVVGYHGMAIVGEDSRIERFAAAEPGISLTEPQRLRMDQGDAFVFGNFAAMVRSGEPAFQRQRLQIQRQINEMEAAGDEAPWAAQMIPMMRMQLDVMDNFWKVAQQADWMSAMILLDEQAADVELALAFLADSPVGRFFSQHPPIGERLTPGLPDVEAFAAIWYSLDRQRTVAMLSNLLEQTINLQGRMRQFMQQQPGDAEVQAQIQQQQQQLRQVVEMLKNLDWIELRGSFAMFAPPQGEQGLRALQTIRLTDVENWRQRLQQYVEQAQGISPLGPGAPGELRLTYEPRQRTIGEMAIDRYTQQLILPEAPPTDPQQRMVINLLRGIFGPDGRMVSWVAESGGYMLSQTAPEPDMMQQMAAALEGNGLAQSRRFGNLSQFIVPQANFVGYLSLNTISRGLRDMIMQAGGQQPPQDQAAQPMTYSAISEAWTEGRAHARMYIPITEMQGLVANLMPLMMQLRNGPPNGEFAPPPEGGAAAPEGGETF